ncbi:hypothetical protein [Streptomyces sp. NPDC059708]|uniref:hypothetical protein n=1 Tax=Streptomyces sp. NPDC059708 TaxID=3346916 RepID=UPI0036B3D0F9
MTDPASHPFPVKGEVAVFHGAPYRARGALGLWPCVELLPEPGRPAPEGLAPREGADGSVGYPVAPERLAAWYAVTWTFRWRGEPFECTAATPTTLRGRYLGSDERFAKEHLKRLVSDYRGVFPRDEVSEMVQHHEDLLQPLHARVRRLAEVDHFRPRTYAVHRGRTYPAAAEADASGLIALTTGRDRPEAPGDGHFPVAPGELDAWFRIHWTFRSHGEPFDAVGTVDGRVKGVYTGRSHGFIAHSATLTPETGPDGVTRYTVRVDVDGVAGLERHRTDLLADL